MTSTVSASLLHTRLVCSRRSITALPLPFKPLDVPAVSSGWSHRRSTGRSTAPSRFIAMASVPVLTQIPKSKTNEEAVLGLLQLAHDCSAAYGQASEKANDAELKQALKKFAGQADSQIDQWRGLSDAPPEKETTISTSANSNKVKFANIAGDKAIVAVILNNSNDSVAAYDAISKRSEFPKQTTSLAAKLLPQAQEQRAFLEKFTKS